MAKETLATEQAKAASKEQLAKAMKDLCYATLLSSLLVFLSATWGHGDQHEKLEPQNMEKNTIW